MGVTLFPFFTADHGLPVFSGNLFFYDPLSLSLFLFNSIQLPPPSGQNQSDPCHFRAHPQPPRCFHCPGSAIGCGRLVGGWNPGPVRVLYIYFISSLVYFFIPMLSPTPYYSVYSVQCTTAICGDFFYFILFLFKLFNLFVFFAFWISFFILFYFLFLLISFIALPCSLYYYSRVYYKDTGTQKKNKNKAYQSKLWACRDGSC